jgi:hypothetical protein
MSCPQSDEFGLVLFVDGCFPCYSQSRHKEQRVDLIKLCVLGGSAVKICTRVGYHIRESYGDPLAGIAAGGVNHHPAGSAPYPETFRLLRPFRGSFVIQIPSSPSHRHPRSRIREIFVDGLLTSPSLRPYPSSSLRQTPWQTSAGEPHA